MPHLPFAVLLLHHLPFYNQSRKHTTVIWGGGSPIEWSFFPTQPRARGVQRAAWITASHPNPFFISSPSIEQLACRRFYLRGAIPAPLSAPHYASGK